MDHLIRKFLIKVLSKTLTLEDIRTCELLQENWECPLIDYISGFAVSKPDENAETILRELKLYPEVLLSYKYVGEI
jgi:hypothetical protein